MLSYQHMYHAGSAADVHKHRILAKLLLQLVKKNKPLSYMETHAGRGLYDICCDEALKTGEAANGIEIFLTEACSNNDPCAELVRQMRKNFSLDSIYPGSPMIAREILRAEDQIFLMELHPVEIEYLRENMILSSHPKLQSEIPGESAGDPHKTYEHFVKRKPAVRIHHRDGYEGVLALSPPTYRRGVVLIDPSYEVKKEYQQVVSFISKLYKKWAESVIMLWYPILPQLHHIPMLEELKSMDFKNMIINEVSFPNAQNFGIQGSGVVMINTPWGLEEQLENS